MAQPAPDAIATAQKALDLLFSGNYAEYTAMLAPQYKSSLTEAHFTKTSSEIKGYGAVEKRGEPKVQDMGTSKAVTFPVVFTTTAMNFRFAINSSGKISAMYQTPGEGAWTPPSYCKPDAFRVRDVTVGEGDWKLPGTLAVPNGKGPFPAVVLIQGFGPKDRDNTTVALKPFHDISDGLASRGIAVLRYEKRTVQYASRLAGKPYTPAEEFVDDAVLALAVLRAQPEVDPKRVYLLAHDMGGYVAPRIAEEDEKLAGMIIMGANEMPLEDVMLGQLVYMGLSGKDLNRAKSAVDRVKALEPSDADGPPILQIPVGYWLDLKGYDPTAVAKRLTMPILVLQGERDFQVPMNNFELWKKGLEGRKAVTAKSYPALNHYFVAGEGKSSLMEYSKLGHVAPEVIDDLTAFVTK